MRTVFLNDSANGDWYLFYWGLMLLWLMRVGFENSSTASGKSNVSRVIPRLYGWVYKTWRLFPLPDEHTVVVITAGSQSMGMLEWNTYLNFNSDIVNFVWKTNEGEGRGAESIVLSIFVLWSCFTCQWERGCGLLQKVLFRASWNLIFFQPGFKSTQ